MERVFSVRVLAPALMSKCLKAFLTELRHIDIANSQAPVLLLAGSDWEARLETYRLCFPRCCNAGIVLVTEGEEHHLLGAQRQAIRVLVAWKETESWLPDAIAAASKRIPLISPSLSGPWSHITGTPPPPPSTRPQPLLSERESEVVACAVDGLSNLEISQLIHASIPTVKFHLTNAYRKLGVTKRKELAAILPAAAPSSMPLMHSESS